jgi:3-oxoacyl-[acyl-carrier-protein] synthase II
MVGHCLSAAGVIEAAVLAISLDRGMLTIHYRERDPECDVDIVSNGRELPISYVFRHWRLATMRS